MSFTLISKEKLRAIFLTGFIFCVLNARPALFGHLFSDAYVLFPIAALTLLSLFLGFRVRFRGSTLVLFGLVVLYVVWVLFQLLLLSPATIYIGEVLGLTILIVALGTTVLIGETGATTALKALVLLMVFLALSQLITYLLFFLGFQGDILLLEKDVRDNAAIPLRLYFPFTTTLHFVKIAGHRIQRAVGFWREPGLYQLFIITSYFATDFIRLRHKTLVRWLLVFSLLTTFSTAGYAIFLGCLAYKNFFMRRGHFRVRLVALLIVGGAFLAFLSAPYFGLQDKLLRSEKRLLSPLASWELLCEQPIVGYGITSEEELYPGVKLGINFLSSLHQHGIVGLGLYLGLVACALAWHYNRRTVILLLPVLVTALVAQPLYGTAFMFFMLFLPTRGLEFQEKDAIKYGR